MNDLTAATPLHDLAADWGWMDGSAGFVLVNGSVVWETAAYGTGRMIRVERFSVTENGAGRRVSYFDPATLVFVVRG
tara:strand:+ start:482 stop:712 length:231 start_codon:yes stop_codon:yes gene_type:complete